jgi:uncharacterized protein involved in cysteine biosynthesis
MTIADDIRCWFCFWFEWKVAKKYVWRPLHDAIIRRPCWALSVFFFLVIYLAMALLRFKVVVWGYDCRVDQLVQNLTHALEILSQSCPSLLQDSKGQVGAGNSSTMGVVVVVLVVTVIALCYFLFQTSTANDEDEKNVEGDHRRAAW